MGDILTWDPTADSGNGAWVASPAPVYTDTDTTYTNGAGLSLTPGATASDPNVFSVNAPACATGQYLTWDGTAFSCQIDQDTITVDTDTKYGAKANGGLVLDANNDFALMTCTDQEILKWNGTTSRWECSTDLDHTYDLSGYLQIADLQSAIDGLTPGYYTKTEVDTLLNNFATTIPAGGLKVPQQVALESSLSVASCTEAGDYFFIQDMDVTRPGHTGRAWCYEDGSGNMQLYKVYDDYLSPDTTSIISNNGVLSVSTTWLDTYLATKHYATEQFVADEIAKIDFTPYVKYTDIPTCSAGYVLTSTTAGVFSCTLASTTDNDTTYTNGAGLKLTPGATPTDPNVFSIDASACTAGQYLTWNGSAFSCQADLDTDTTYTAADGKYLLYESFTSPRIFKDPVDIEAADVDGDANGEYKKKTLTFEAAPFKRGRSKWDEGTSYNTVDFEMEADVDE